MEKDILLSNVSKIHTTTMGEERIMKNLKIGDDPVDYCKKIVLDSGSLITKNGKNFYVVKDKIVITINSYSYTIITAHLTK